MSLTDEQRARISAGTRAAVAQRRDGTLAARDAKAVRLALEQRLSQREIADQLGISPGAVAGILFRARRDGTMPRHPLPRAKAVRTAATRDATAPQPLHASGTGFTWSTTEQRAAMGRAMQHKARMRSVPKLTEAEAARLIAEAEAAGRVTQCPAKFLNAVAGAS